MVDWFAGYATRRSTAPPAPRQLCQPSSGPTPTPGRRGHRPHPGCKGSSMPLGAISTWSSCPASGSLRPQPPVPHHQPLYLASTPNRVIQARPTPLRPNRSNLLAAPRVETGPVPSQGTLLLVPLRFGPHIFEALSLGSVPGWFLWLRRQPHRHFRLVTRPPAQLIQQTRQAVLRTMHHRPWSEHWSSRPHRITVTTGTDSIRQPRGGTVRRGGMSTASARSIRCGYAT